MRRQNSNCKQDTSYLLFTNFSNRILDLQMKFLNVYLQVEINRIKWEKRLKTINIKNFLLMKRLANETNVSFMERRLTLKTVFWLQDLRNNRLKKWDENKGTMIISWRFPVKKEVDFIISHANGRYTRESHLINM